MKDEERMDAAIRELAGDYHRPPATPTAAIWARIQAERAGRRERPAHARVRVRWVTWAVGLAATLAIGVAIGRLTSDRPTPPESVASGGQPELADPAEGASAAYRLVATEHLSQVETFLSIFSAEASAGRPVVADFEVPARQLLRRTRLLRESPAADDVTLRALLDDVEFVLLQIASFAQVGDERELGFVEQGMTERSVLLRLRSALPSVPERVAAEGSL